MNRIFSTLAVLLITTTGCSESPTEPAPQAPQATLLASQEYGRYSVRSGRQSTHGEFELIVGMFDAPRTTADPQYHVFDGYSYSPGDAGRTITINNDEQDPDFSKVATLLTDGVRNTMRFRTRRVGGSMNTLDSTDYSVAKAAGYTTEDLTGRRVTELRIEIIRLQITHEGGDTVEDVEWRLDIYGY